MWTTPSSCRSKPPTGGSWTPSPVRNRAHAGATPSTADDVRGVSVSKEGARAVARLAKPTHRSRRGRRPAPPLVLLASAWLSASRPSCRALPPTGCRGPSVISRPLPAGWRRRPRHPHALSGRTSCRARPRPGPTRGGPQTALGRSVRARPHEPCFRASRGVLLFDAEGRAALEANAAEMLLSAPTSWAGPCWIVRNAGSTLAGRAARSDCRLAWLDLGS